MTAGPTPITIGVLALQGAFAEHLSHLTTAATTLPAHPYAFTFLPVRTPEQLAACAALIIPGGESTAISLLAERSGLLQPLRDFVKLHRRPTWGTCAGMILLADAANRTKKGGQELVGGLRVRVDRNAFGRQTESFVSALQIAGVTDGADGFEGVFIRAPVVESVLGKEEAGAMKSAGETVVAPEVGGEEGEVEVLAKLPAAEGREERIVAVRQGNVVGTSFHPELTADVRLHRWWLEQVLEDLERRRQKGEL